MKGVTFGPSHSPNTILGVTLKEGLNGLKPSFWYDSALKTCFRVAQINCKTTEGSVSTTEYNVHQNQTTHRKICIFAKNYGNHSSFKFALCGVGLVEAPQ